MHTSPPIFSSAVRTFLNCFAAILGILLAFILIGVLIVSISEPKMFPKGTELAILPDAEGNRELLSHTAPVILQIPIRGVIGDDDLTSDAIDQILLDSRDGFFKDNRVKGILLYMNTPGGTADDSDRIYRSLLRYKQKYNLPIYAYATGICASGGMYITSAADKIYADNSSILGSVGVLLGPVFNFSGAMEKIGVQSLTLTEGKDKDMLNPFRPWRPGEQDSLKRINDAFYDDFVSVFTEAHPRVDKEKLINDYGAQVFIAKEAEEIGFIDVANTDYSTTLRDLVQAAGIAASEPYQVVELKLPHSFLYELAKGKSPMSSGKITHQFDFGPHFNSKMSGKFLYLYLPQDTHYLN